MKKRIELPLGLSINDVSNIGQFTLVSGRQYDVGLIRGSEIGTVLNSPSITPRALCTHTGINKWAAFKPNRGNHPSGMIISNQEFLYDGPDSISGYKLGDFAGYNHNAPIPEVLQGGTVQYLSDGGTGSFVLLISLPEFDVRDFDIDGICVISRKQGGGFQYYNTYNLDDVDIGNKSAGVEVSYDRLSSSYSMELEVWYKNPDTNQFVKHNDFISTVSMEAIQEPQINYYAEIPLRMTYVSDNYNYTTGSWSLSGYRIFDDMAGVQVGGNFAIYAKRPSDSKWSYQKTVSVSSTNENGANGTLTFTKPISEDVTLEFRQV